MGSAFLSGFVVSISLIAAIGAQNAFVLRQGLKREHVLPIVLACAGSDAILIAAGVLGIGELVDRFPSIVTVVGLGGAAFLVVYGALRLRAAWLGGEALAVEQAQKRPLWPVLLSCLALTWGNPHVYLDTLVLLGSIAQGYGEGRAAFGVGAALASFVFFMALGFGARLLTPIFVRPVAWRILDVGVAALMWSIAGQLVAELA
ncbi:MAG: amino acid transporter [Alphaproteobacteria bacterium]|nr:MAG: amino acid transporter [Alphaproteobacteria bacterium]